MKTSLLFTALVMPLLITSAATAYPPDNAAVLYYKHMEHFAKPAEVVWDEITKLPTNSEPASKEVLAFIQQQKENQLIPELLVASEIKYCDWGLDVSQGFDMLMPGLSEMKCFACLLLAEGAVDAQGGNMTAAIDTNLATRRMAQHITNDTLIGFLVNIAIFQKCDNALTFLLENYPIDAAALGTLQNELKWEIYQPKSIRHPMMMEKEVCINEIYKMTAERCIKLIDDCGNKETVERINKLFSSPDEAFLEKSAAYYEKQYDAIMLLMDNSLYPQAYAGIGKAVDQMGTDAETNDETVLAALLCPALSKCYSLHMLNQTRHSALMLSLELYKIAAETGKLPQALLDLPYLDHFSGKPFIYEITEDGFILRCQQEDLVKKKIHEFVYKLPK